MVTFDEIYNYIASQLATNQFFSAAAISSVLFTAFAFLKSVPRFIWSRIYRLIDFSITIEDNSLLYACLFDYIQTHYPQNLRRLEAKAEYVDRAKYNYVIKYNQDSDTNYIWYKRRRLTISSLKDRLESAVNTENLFNRKYYIRGFFAKKAIQELLQEAYNFSMEKRAREQEERTEIKIWANAREYGSGWDRINVSGNKTFNEIFFEGKEELMADLNHFIATRDLFKKHHVNYKRGYMFEGLPGNGKSSVAYAIGEYLKYDIYLFSLNNMGEREFARLFYSIPNKSVVLIEDIDSFYEGRKPLGKNEVSFSSFLNVLSGVANKNEIITIFTTNHIEKLDPALLRDGRCDFTMTFKNPNKEVVEKYLSFFFGKEITLDFTPPKMSFSAVQKITIRNANDLSAVLTKIKNYNAKNEKEDLSMPTISDVLPPAPIIEQSARRGRTRL